MLPGARQINKFTSVVPPAGQIALATPIGAAAGYWGGPLLLQTILGMLGQGNALKDLDLDTFKKVSAALGALGAAAITGYKKVDFGDGYDGLVQSLIDPQYWKTHRDRANAVIAAEEAKRDKKRYKSNLNYGDSRGLRLPGLDKISAEDDYYRLNIPTERSLEVVGKDPVLNTFQKLKAEAVIGKASSGGIRPLISGSQLTQSALKFGLDYGTSYLLGKGIGTLLRVPEPVLNKLSVTGALGAAIINTGLFDSGETK